MPKSDHFFEEMPGFTEFSQFTQMKNYRPLPADWFIVITDIEGSTREIEKGKYKQVNSISAASMIAVQNVYDSIDLPYVFGGDGATLCVPPVRINAVKAALAASRELAMKSFGLVLRVGLVPATVIEEKNLQVLVAKFQPHDSFKQAMFQGEGLSYAEMLVKSSIDDNPYILKDDITPHGNFEGYECRWNEIPSSSEETIALMVKTLNREDDERENIYEDIFNKINEIYGEDSNCHPLNASNLSLTLSPMQLLAEVRIKEPDLNVIGLTLHLVKLFFLVISGKYLMAKEPKVEGRGWGAYKDNLVLNTDYRKFDETLRMIICGTRKQREALSKYLDQLHQEQRIVFGIHEQDGAIVTCMIKDYEKDHVHFLDGANGGYAMAAKKMKQQLEVLATENTGP